MDEQRIKGGAKKTEGSVKEGAGHLTGDRDLKAEGRADKAEGDTRSAVGKAKDAVRDAIKK